MEASERIKTEITESIAAGTRMGTVHLYVADLQRQIEFYEDLLGLGVHWSDGGDAGLGTGNEDLLRLTELPGARRSQGTTGLYHFAILLPSRKELARVIARLFTRRYPNGPTDHLMTKTTYLDDPEGNTIEIYADTPEDGIFRFRDGIFIARHADGRRSDGREPLDVETLLESLETTDDIEQGMPRETTIGHVHLHVADLDAHVPLQLERVHPLGDRQVEVEATRPCVSTATSSVLTIRASRAISVWEWSRPAATITTSASTPGGERVCRLRPMARWACATSRFSCRTTKSLLAYSLTLGASEETDDGVLLRDPSQNRMIIAIDPK